MLEDSSALEDVWKSLGSDLEAIWNPNFGCYLKAISGMISRMVARTYCLLILGSLDEKLFSALGICAFADSSPKSLLTML